MNQTTLLGAISNRLPELLEEAKRTRIACREAYGRGLFAGMLIGTGVTLIIIALSNI